MSMPASMKDENLVPRIESLKVKNYRALGSLELHGLTPLTVFLGPNGSGKSTLFDVFAFLSECFSIGLRKAWDKRGRFKELLSRGSKGPIEFEIKYRESLDTGLITYHLAIVEIGKAPVVADEWLQWNRTNGGGKPFKFLDFKFGRGRVISGDQPDERAERVDEGAERIVYSSIGRPPRSRHDLQ
jgi:predicted ATPase